MISKIKKPVSILLALMMVVSLFTIVPMTVSAAPTESLLITIDSVGHGEEEGDGFISGSRTFNNIATVSFSSEVENDDDNDGWYTSGWSNKILSVAPAAGYTITKVKFYNRRGSAFDETSPFEATLYAMNMYVNGSSYGSGGVTKIEVYGYATPAHTEHTYTANPTFNWSQDASTGDWNCNKLTLTCSDCDATQDYEVAGYFGTSAVTCTANTDGGFTYSVSKTVDGTKYEDSKTYDANSVVKSATQLKAAAKKGGEWELGSDIAEVTGVSCADGFVLDGNNKTLSAHTSVKTSPMFKSANKTAEYTLKNLTIDGVAGETQYQPAISSATTSTGQTNVINLEGVTITNYDFDQANNGAVLAFGQAKVNLTNCNIDTDSQYDVWGGAASTVNVDGGKVGGLYLNGGTSSANLTNSADVDSITAANGSKIATDAPDKISVGEDYKLKDNGDGTYTVVPKDYVAQIGTTGYETLTEAIAAAQVGDTVKLLSNVSETVTISGKTLTLDLNGFNITSASKKMPITAIEGTKLTIINSNEEKAENTATQNAIMGPSGSNNQGSLNAKGEGTTVDIYAGYYYGYNGNKTAINAINGATVTFWGGTVNGAKGINDTTAGKEGKVFYSGVSNPTKPYATTPGYIVVHGGNFSGRMSDSNWGNYLIDGGTFDRNAVVLNENPVDADGNRVATATSSMTQIGTGTLYDAGWLADGYIPKANGDGTYSVKTGTYVAQVGDDKYETFAEAVTAANGAEVITLLADAPAYVMTGGETLKVNKNGFKFSTPKVQGAYVVNSATADGVTTYTTAEASVKYTNAQGVVSYSNSVPGSSNGTYQLLKDFTTTNYILPGTFASDVTIDLNGHTFTSSGARSGYETAVLLSRNGTETAHKKFTIKNGKIVYTNANSPLSAVTISGKYNDVTIENVTIESAVCGIQVTGDNNDLAIKGSTITGTNDFALATNGAKTTNATITVENSTLTSDGSIGVYLPGDADVTFTNTDVTGTTAMYIKGGNVTVNGGTITANGAKAEYSYNGNGANATGDAIVVESCNYPAGVPALTISGNPTITSTNGVQIGDYTYQDNTAPKVTATSNTMTLPIGLSWIPTETEGVYTVGAALFVAHSITLDGNIELNFFINPDYANFDDASSAKVKFSWDGNTTEVDLKNPVLSEDGWYKASVELVAAEMANVVHAEVYRNNEKIGEDDYTVREYAEELYKYPKKYDKKGKPEELRALAKALLNYGAMAQTVFAGDLTDDPRVFANANLDAEDKTAYASVKAEDIDAAIKGEASDMNKVADKLGGKFYTSSVIYLNQNKLRLYFTPKSYPGTLPYKYSGIVEGYYYYVESEAIPAAELDQQQHFEVGGVKFNYSALDYAKAVVESNMGPEAKNLAKALFCYYQAAKAYCG